MNLTHTRSARLASGLLASLLVLAAGTAAADVGKTPPADYNAQIDQWRKERVDRLTSPGSWLSLIALKWLAPGANTVGSAADNTVVLPKGPAHLGTVNWTNGQPLTLSLLPESGAQVDGAAPTAPTVNLIDDTQENQKPTKVSFGTVSFTLIDRAGRKALRVRDSEAETRTHFLGLDYFPTDPSWRIAAKWVPYATPKEIMVQTVIGTTEKTPVPGEAVFEKNGVTYHLPLMGSIADESLNVVFTDATSGKETYAASRFLDIDNPADGIVVVDFNKAYNPPCAFTPYATCPLAPKEDRLTLAVTAGEKKYRGGHH